MSTEVLFQPLYGSANYGPVASLLEIDGFKILLDCGWTETFNVELLEPLRAFVPPMYHNLTVLDEPFHLVHVITGLEAVN
jgi:cleavage and polyadenylation specificity factor subunit 2